MGIPFSFICKTATGFTPGHAPGTCVCKLANLSCWLPDSLLFMTYRHACTRLICCRAWRVWLDAVAASTGKFWVFRRNLDEDEMIDKVHPCIARFWTGIGMFMCMCTARVHFPSPH